MPGDSNAVTPLSMSLAYLQGVFSVWVATRRRGRGLGCLQPPQELRVALQVAEGLTNHEVAARLFLSYKTIEVHLSHIYGKLGVRTRTGLAKLINSGAVRQ